MALLTVYSLLLFSMLHATTHGDLCELGSYCPAGVDCNSNSSLCEVGVCNVTTGENCVRDISLQFGSSTYDVNENNGPAQPVLILDGPLECCSISVTVKVEDISAKGDEDYDMPPNQYIKVRFSAGETRVSFDVNIIDDDLMENSETFRITIYDLSVPYGITLGSITSAEVTIVDNDSTTLSFSKSTFRVNETEGPAQPELALSVPALFDFNVFITSVNVHLAATCDKFQSGPFEVIFPNGTTTVTFPVNITDDDVYEEYESFNLVIDNNLPNRVNLGHPSRAAIVIVDDEKPIQARFDKNVYRVHEHQGTIAPEIKLSEPSPCCFILHAKLNNDTALGRTIDYGYASPKIYNYTFHAGSTCASPDANITITDDLELEKEETFKISIIEAALPFGVEADEGGTATILINDNDNAVSFRYKDHAFGEDEPQIFLELLLEDPAKNDLVIQVNSHSNTATGGDDYSSGPYDVFFASGQTAAYLFISLLDDELYEGDEYFNVTIGSLPHGIVRAHPDTANIKIVDDEYVCCFEPRFYDVIEGENVEVYITCSKLLPTTLTVQLEYFDVTATKNTDYYTSTSSVRLNAGTNKKLVTIRTREDSTLEDKYEYFDVKATYPLKPNNSFCDELSITIVDDDESTISFDRNEYRSAESSLTRPRLVLSKTPTSTFTVNIEEKEEEVEDRCNCDAKGGEDYKSQRYNSVRFVKGGSRYVELTTAFINDDIVEDDECYHLKIVPDTLPERIIVVNPNYTKIVIQNDDVCTVTLEENRLKFSNKIDSDVEVEISYRDGVPRLVTKTLIAGGTEIILDASRSRSLQRITIYPDCCLDSNDFRIRSSRLYLRFRNC